MSHFIFRDFKLFLKSPKLFQLSKLRLHYFEQVNYLTEYFEIEVLIFLLIKKTEINIIYFSSFHNHSHSSVYRLL